MSSSDASELCSALRENCAGRYEVALTIGTRHLVAGFRPHQTLIHARGN